MNKRPALIRGHRYLGASACPPGITDFLRSGDTNGYFYMVLYAGPSLRFWSPIALIMLLIFAFDLETNIYGLDTPERSSLNRKSNFSFVVWR